MIVCLIHMISFNQFKCLITAYHSYYFMTLALGSCDVNVKFENCENGSPINHFEFGQNERFKSK